MSHNEIAKKLPNVGFELVTSGLISVTYIEDIMSGICKKKQRCVYTSDAGKSDVGS